MQTDLNAANVNLGAIRRTVATSLKPCNLAEDVELKIATSLLRDRD